MDNCHQLDKIPNWKKKSLFPFWTLPKNKNLTQRARELRKQGILSEVIFWKEFKYREKLKGWDLDRQVIIGDFIVDFFIAELGLVIEIDGSSHNHKIEYDKERKNFLTGLSLKVIRYYDDDIKYNIEGVYKDFISKIEERVEELKKSNNFPPRPSDTPQKGNNSQNYKSK